MFIISLSLSLCIDTKALNSVESLIIGKPQYLSKFLFCHYCHSALASGGLSVIAMSKLAMTYGIPKAIPKKTATKPGISLYPDYSHVGKTNDMHSSSSNVWGTWPPFAGGPTVPQGHFDASTISPTNPLTPPRNLCRDRFHRWHPRVISGRKTQVVISWRFFAPGEKYWAHNLFFSNLCSNIQKNQWPKCNIGLFVFFWCDLKVTSSLVWHSSFSRRPAFDVKQLMRCGHVHSIIGYQGQCQTDVTITPLKSIDIINWCQTWSHFNRLAFQSHRLGYPCQSSRV